MKTVYSEVAVFGFQLIVKQAANGEFSVQYGKRMRKNLNYAQAAKEFGECYFHALAYQGNIDMESAAE
jgi:hypothetical protein